MTTPGARLRDIIQNDMVVAPGCYDGITSKLIAAAGHHAAYMSGAATSASLGYPDFGLITMTEMVDNAARITRSIDIPLICDADTERCRLPWVAPPSRRWEPEPLRWMAATGLARIGRSADEHEPEEDRRAAQRGDVGGIGPVVGQEHEAVGRGREEPDLQAGHE